MRNRRGFRSAGIIILVSVVLLLLSFFYYLMVSKNRVDIFEGDCLEGQPDCDDYLVDGAYPPDGDEVSPTEILPPVSE